MLDTTAVQTVEFFGPGGLYGAAPMTYARTGHACAALSDGAVFVAGGRSSSVESDTAEIYNPATNAWTVTAHLPAPLSGATASRLPDGRVLIAGGETGGTPSASLLVFDPATGGFETLPVHMSTPRSHHAAAVLKDGRVVLAGGTNGHPLASVEVYDPATGQVSALAQMATPRQGLTATALLDGRVFLAGGNDGTADLTSTELLDASTGSVAPGAQMDVPRSGHVAFRLPKNNQVLLADSNSAVLYVPWRDVFRSLGSLLKPAATTITSTTSGALTMKSATRMSADTTVSSDTYPTIQTDKLDYMPGETVYITGTNWTPGATVSLVVNFVPDGTVRFQQDVVAKADGTVAASFLVEQTDLGKTFALTATEASTGREAQVWVFTDGNKVGSVTIDPGSQTVIAGNSTSYTVTVYKGTNPGNNSYDVALSVSGLPAGATASFVPSTLTFTSSTSSLQSTLTVNSASSTPSGAVTLTVTAQNSNNDKATKTASLNVIRDSTPPDITHHINGTSGSNGWYTSDVTVSWTVADNESAVTSETGCDTVTLTTDSKGTTYTCQATSAGGSSSKSVTIKRDATPPTATASLDRAADSNGWYNHAVSVNFSGTDATSGNVTCDAAKSYSGPDTSAASVSGTCKDDAGNSATASATFKYDATGPTVTATADRNPDSNGWYNKALTIHFNGSDSVSSGVACDPDVTYSGPDTGAGSISGSCRDAAGNSGTGKLDFKYDSTPPTITAVVTPAQPASTGWYNKQTGAPTVKFTCNDNLSGVSGTCPADYTFPEGVNQSVSKTITDQAGNTSEPASVTGINVDLTPPAVSASTDRVADHNGWYNKTFTVTFTADDKGSGASKCDSPVVYSSPDTDNGSISGSCSDVAGNSAQATFNFKYDQTAPTITLALSPAQPASTGWYNSNTGAPVAKFTCADNLSGVSGACPADYTFPEGANLSVSRTITDQAGNTSTEAAVQGIKVDLTAPAVTPKPDRTPDSNGWYNHAFTVTFSASDSLSGPGTCDDPKSYSTGDTNNGSISGSCSDGAGNSASAAFAFKYDATPPTITASVSPGAAPTAWYNSTTGAPTVSFKCDDAMSGIGSCTAPHTFGEGANQTFTGTAVDQAGNTATAPSPEVSVDLTAPVVEASPDRQPNAAGWYNASVTFTFSGNDNLSLIASCDGPKSYAGPDSASGSLSGTCTDKAGNVGTKLVTVKYDATPPTIVAAISPAQPAYNGWYNTVSGAPTASFTCNDATSGIASCAEPHLFGEGASQTFTGVATDQAGNTANIPTPPVNVDLTAPAVQLSADRSPNTNGWYNAPVKLTTMGTDTISQIDGCDLVQVYQGPDSASASVSGNCTDKAGNKGTASLTLKYDVTPPSIAFASRTAPNENGWNNTPVAVTWNCSDALSGPAAPSVSQTLAGEGAGQSAVGTCSDLAGNTVQGAQVSGINIDLTRPVLTASRSPLANEYGWNNGDVTVSFACSDPLSGVATPLSTPQVVSTEGVGQSRSGSCVDRAGNPATLTVGNINIDKTPPAPPTPLVSPTPNAAGWNNTAVTVAFAPNGDVGPVQSGVLSCTTQSLSSETMGTVVPGSCVDKAGNISANSSTTIKIDMTPPPPPTNVLANPVPIGTQGTVTASASDALSGVGGASYRMGATLTTLGGSVPMNAVDGVFDERNEDVTATLTTTLYSTPGVYQVCVSTTDMAGNTGLDSCALLAVYDASAGFVTGGGWIDSPVGAYAASSSLVGKANFGFVSKYQKGSKVPTGDTEFQFKVGNLNFKSTSYDWLVISGPKAQYKGSGTVNGTGDYGFMLTAIDGSLNGGGGVDKFRIKIWDKATAVVVYDNQMGASDTGDPTTALGGGSIVIHTSK